MSTADQIKAAVERAMIDCSADADEANWATRRMADTHANKMRVLSALLAVFKEDNGLMVYTKVIGCMEEAQEALVNVYLDAA